MYGFDSSSARVNHARKLELLHEFKYFFYYHTDLEIIIQESNPKQDNMELRRHHRVHQQGYQSPSPLHLSKSFIYLPNL